MWVWIASSTSRTPPLSLAWDGQSDLLHRAFTPSVRVGRVSSPLHNGTCSHVEVSNNKEKVTRCVASRFWREIIRLYWQAKLATLIWTTPIHWPAPNRCCLVQFWSAPRETDVTARGWGSSRGWDWADCCFPDSLQWKLAGRRAEAWKYMHVSFHCNVMKAPGHWLNCSTLRNEAQLGSCVNTAPRSGGLWQLAAGKRAFTGANVWKV